MRRRAVVVCLGRGSGLGRTANAADRDRDKVSDDLEARVAPLSAADKANVIVVMRARALPGRVDHLERASGLDVSKRFSLIDAVAGRVTKARLQTLARDPLVDHVERNKPIHAFNDTAQESFGVTAARTNAPTIDGNADGNVNTYSSGDMVAAIIDTGIDASHQDLDEGKVIAFRDFVNNINTPYDDHGHGTHVAGILAGEGDARPDLKYRGVAPGAALVGVKILDSAGNGSSAALISALQWVVDEQGDVQHQGREHVARLPRLLRRHRCGVPGARGRERRRARDVDGGGQRGSGPVHRRVAGRGAEGADRRQHGGPRAEGLLPGVQLQPRQDPRRAREAGHLRAGLPDHFRCPRHRQRLRRVQRDQHGHALRVGRRLLMLEANGALTPLDIKTKIMQTAEDWGRGANNAPATTGADPEYGAGRLDAYAALKSAGAPLGTAPPGPVHAFREGTLSGTGAQIDYPILVRDTRFPIAATMIIPQIVGASANSPDFDLYLISPSGTTVAQSEFITRQEELGFTPTVTGTYIVRVRRSRAAAGSSSTSRRG